MKVKKLIKELQRMPQNLEVFIAEHDNTEWEISGNTDSVVYCSKNILRDAYRNSINKLGQEEIDRFESNPDKWVVIHG